MRQAYSNNIPAAVEYIGLNQWAVRWDVQIDTNRLEEDIIPYVYNEEVLDHLPTCEEVDKITNAGQCDDIQIQAINFVKSIINSTPVSTNKALEMKVLYPVWGKEGAEFGKAVEVGFRLRVVDDNSDILYEVIQAHNLQEKWVPGVDTASLYKVMDIEHAGTQDDPIPYNPPMEIFEGKYYTQDEVLYLCTRNSDTPLSHNLSDLVGTYVTIIE